jgi:hypothetical protein
MKFKNTPKRSELISLLNETLDVIKRMIEKGKLEDDDPSATFDALKRVKGYKAEKRFLTKLLEESYDEYRDLDYNLRKRALGRESDSLESLASSLLSFAEELEYSSR